MSAVRRHSWVKLRMHVYMCRECGTGYENFQHPNGRWARRFFLPTGQTRALVHVPPCEKGPRTAAALRKYADAL